MGIKVLGVPADFGANRRGVDMGASAIRYADLLTKLRQLELDVEDLGDVAVDIVHDKVNANKVQDPITSVYRRLAERVNDIIKQGHKPLVLGGDHSIALGTLAGLTTDQEPGIIWFDAHGDFNDFETSPSGNLHGMILGAIVGQRDEKLEDYCQFLSPVKPENVAIVGARALDVEEKKRLRNSAVTVFTMGEIDRLGMYKVMNQAIDVATTGTDSLHISLDLDVVNPLEAPGVGTPVKGGIDYREAHLAMEMLAELNSLTSLEVVEVNPILDNQNQTANLAVELIKSALGEKIL